MPNGTHRHYRYAKARLSRRAGLFVRYEALRFFGSGCKFLFQIGKNIVDMLGADGQADGVGLDALIRQLRGSQLGVGGGRGMNHQGLPIGSIGKQRGDFQIVDELVRLLLAALN